MRLAPVVPVFVWPEFTLRATVDLATPLFVLGLASQNLPGFAVMRSAGYLPPVRGALVTSGLVTVLLAPMLNHGLTMAAITAAIANNPEAHPDPDRRYAAAVVAGLLTIGLGVCGATVVTLLTALPRPVMIAAAGLELSGTIAQCLASGFTDADARESSLWALVVTAADVSFFGIGSAF